MTTQAAFENAIEESKTLPERPGNNVLLRLYGLYKQATDGDVNTGRPGGFDFKNIAKWDAWKEQQGKSQEEAARTEYVQLVDELVGK